MLEINTETEPVRIHHYKFSDYITDKDMEKYKSHILSEFENKNKFYAIQDVSNVDNFKLNYMKHFLILDQLFKNKNLVKKYVGATVVIVKEKNRNMFDLIFKFRKTVTPNKILTDLEEGVKFIFSL